MIALIDGFLWLLWIYLLIGAVFGIYFVLRGAAKLDDGISEAPWHTRLIIYPGSVLLWIILVGKLMKSK